jgi:flagella basal body P-ring formation protein FlgA
VKFFAFGMLFFSLFVRAQEHKAVVRLHELSTVRMNEPILLSQVATFEHVSPSLKEKLQSVVIHEGLSKDGIQDIKNQDLIAMLRNRMSFVDSQKVTFKIPAELKFKASRSHIYAQDLQSQVIAQAQTLCGENCVVEIEDLHLPLISSQTEVMAYKLDTRALRQAGSFVLPLTVETSKGRQNLWLTGKVRMSQKALVALRMLNPGERVSAEDFRVETVDVSFAKDGVPSLEQLQNRVVSRPVRLGQTLYFGDLKAVNAAERGEPVKIVLGDEAYEVSMMGVAEQSGSLGQAIKVKTAEKKILVGELIDDRVVRVK